MKDGREQRGERDWTYYIQEGCCRDRRRHKVAFRFDLSLRRVDSPDWRRIPAIETAVLEAIDDTVFYVRPTGARKRL